MEEISVINKRLVDNYGKYQDGQPMYRVVWSEDQLEKVRTNFTPEGFELNYFYVREQPKYRQWIHNKYILERLIEVPDMAMEVYTTKLSYEPIWVFEDKNGNALPPIWPAIEMAIGTLLKASAAAVGKKYKDPREDEWDPKIAVEARLAKLNELEAQLFGNETPVGDALAHKSGVALPVNPLKG